MATEINPFGDVKKMIEQFKMPGVDMTAIVDARRKDIEALVAANAAAFEAMQALARKHHVAFFHIDGPIVPGDAAKHAIEATVISAPGVDKGSVRVAVDTLTLSLAFDPARTPLPALQAVLDKKLRAKGLALMPLRVIDSPAELKLVKR